MTYFKAYYNKKLNLATVISKLIKVFVQKAVNCIMLILKKDLI